MKTIKPFALGFALYAACAGSTPPPAGPVTLQNLYSFVIDAVQSESSDPNFCEVSLTAQELGVISSTDLNSVKPREVPLEYKTKVRYVSCAALIKAGIVNKTGLIDRKPTVKQKYAINQIRISSAFRGSHWALQNFLQFQPTPMAPSNDTLAQQATQRLSEFACPIPADVSPQEMQLSWWPKMANKQAVDAFVKQASAAVQSQGISIAPTTLASVSTDLLHTLEKSWFAEEVQQDNTWKRNLNIPFLFKVSKENQFWLLGISTDTYHPVFLCSPIQESSQPIQKVVGTLPAPARSVPSVAPEASTELVEYKIEKLTTAPAKIFFVSSVTRPAQSSKGAPLSPVQLVKLQKFYQVKSAKDLVGQTFSSQLGSDNDVLKALLFAASYQGAYKTPTMIAVYEKTAEQLASLKCPNLAADVDPLTRSTYFAPSYFTKDSWFEKNLKEKIIQKAPGAEVQTLVSGPGIRNFSVTKDGKELKGRLSANPRVFACSIAAKAKTPTARKPAKAIKIKTRK